MGARATASVGIKLGKSPGHGTWRYASRFPGAARLSYWRRYRPWRRAPRSRYPACAGLVQGLLRCG